MSRANKRVRSRRPRDSRDLLNQPHAAESKSRPRQLSKRSAELQGQIERLECFIAAAPHIAKKQRLKTLDYVPAYETQSGPRPRRKLLLHQKRTLNLQRYRLLVELGVVAVGIAGLAGWLNQCFHFF